MQGHDHPEDHHEADLSTLVAEELLADESPREPKGEREEVEGALGDPASIELGSALVDGISDEGHEAHCKVREAPQRNSEHGAREYAGEPVDQDHRAWRPWL